MNTPTLTEHTFDRSTVAKLRKRIFLPTDVAAQTQEERYRFYLPSDNLPVIIEQYQYSYTTVSGWSLIWLDHRTLCLQADAIEVIKRQHKYGKFILFRVWKLDSKQLASGEK